jgi:hypothetical protein
MCRGRLDWGKTEMEYKKWVLKSNESQALLHRGIHAAVVSGMDTSILYKARGKEKVLISGSTNTIIISSFLTHKSPDQWELSSMNHVDQILYGAWRVLSNKVGHSMKGDAQDLINAVKELNSLMAA